MTFECDPCTPYDLWLEEASRSSLAITAYDSLDDLEYGYTKSKYIYDSRNVILSSKEMIILLQSTVVGGMTKARIRSYDEYCKIYSRAIRKIHR